MRRKNGEVIDVIGCDIIILELKKFSGDFHSTKMFEIFETGINCKEISGRKVN